MKVIYTNINKTSSVGATLLLHCSSRRATSGVVCLLLAFIAVAMSVTVVTISGHCLYQQVEQEET